MAQVDYPRSLADAREALTCRVRVLASRKIGHNTRLVNFGSLGAAIRLHRTDVVIFYPDGRIHVTTGGWETMTTFDRINGFLRAFGWRVSRDRGEIKVWGPPCRYPFPFDWERDGFTFEQDTMHQLIPAP